jgi:hypothetical protein
MRKLGKISQFLLAAALVAVAIAGCSSKRSDASDPPESKRYKSPPPQLDSQQIRQAILGSWRQVPPDSLHLELGIFDRDINLVVIEPFEDRKDPTVLNIERTLASWGHGNGPFRDPANILADIRIRTQREDGRDIDTLVVSGHFYPEDAEIGGHYLGARDKGEFSIRIVGTNCALINGFAYLREKRSSPKR